MSEEEKFRIEFMEESIRLCVYEFGYLLRTALTREHDIDNVTALLERLKSIPIDATRNYF